MVRSLKVAFWDLGERCEGGMAERLRGIDKAVKPW